MTDPVAQERQEGVSRLTVALVGNPNCGKTTLFNALTGMRQKVGNYAGVTVEKKEGRIRLPGGAQARLINLPGLYSLTPHSPDEVIAREVLMGLRQDTPRPDVILNVVDATNLERNLYLTSQLLDIGVPVVIVLTMTDMLVKEGKVVYSSLLEQQIGRPVVSVVTSQKLGIDALLKALESAVADSVPEPAWRVPDELLPAIEEVKELLEQEQSLVSRFAFAEAVVLLMSEEELPSIEPISRQVRERIRAIHSDLMEEGIDFPALIIDARYGWIERIVGELWRRPVRRSPKTFRILSQHASEDRSP